MPALKPHVFTSKPWFVIAFSIFLAAAIIGLTMRYMFVWPIPQLSFRNLVHAHSHIAHMGWAFMLTIGAIIYYFKSLFPKKRTITTILVINMISIIGMTATFIPLGYAPASIAFSAIHLVAGFYFGIYVLRKLKYVQPSTPHFFLKWAIYFYFISSLGLFAIGPIGAKLGPGHYLYPASIEFFMHFQFNGWHMLTLLAILFKFLESLDYKVHFSDFTTTALIFSVFFTFLPNITHALPYASFFMATAIGLVLQTIAYGIIITLAFSILQKIKPANSLVKNLFILGLASLVVKVIIQTGAAIPTIANVAHSNHFFVIGFIHLIMLGAITFTISALLIHQAIIPFNAIARIGWVLLALGFLLTEAALFSQGTLLWAGFFGIPHYYILLFAFSTLLPASLILIIIGFYTTKTGTSPLF